MFKESNSYLRKLDNSIGEDVKYPICWDYFTLNAIDTFSVEHILPLSACSLVN
jgi:hypothetical protein